MAISELDRKFRVVDQMLSQHAAMRDKYRRRSISLRLLLLLCSVMLCGLTLVTVTDWEVIGIDPESGRWILAVAGCVVFFLSLTEMLVNWPESYESHRSATVRLGELKGRLRDRLTQDELSHRMAKQIGKECDEVLSQMVPIPEREFLKLKARHVRKIAVSRALDDRPGAPVWLLHLELWWAGVRKHGHRPSARSGDSDGKT